MGKEYKAVYCHSAYLIYTQSTSCEMPDWLMHKLESRLQGEISTTSDMHMLPLSFPDSSIGQEFVAMQETLVLLLSQEDHLEKL